MGMSWNKVTVDGDWRKATGTDLELICILSMPSTLRGLHVATVNQASLAVSREREFLFMFWSAKLLHVFFLVFHSESSISSRWNLAYSSYGKSRFFLNDFRPCSNRLRVPEFVEVNSFCRNLPIESKYP